MFRFSVSFVLMILVCIFQVEEACRHRSFMLVSREHRIPLPVLNKATN